MTVENQGDAPVVVNNAPESSAGGAGKAESDAISSFAAAEAAYNKVETPVSEEVEETPAGEAAEGEEVEEVEAAEGEEEKPVAETKAAEGKLSKGQQKKADRAAAAARREGEERATKAEAEAAKLREENAALKSGKKPEPAAATADDEPDPDKFEYGALDPAYQKAVRAFDKAQIKRELLADQQADAAKAKASETTAAYEKQVDSLLEEHDDYYEVVEDGFKAGKWTLPEGFSPILMESPVGAKIAYELAKNPAESRRIAALPVLKQAAEFGKMEARLTDPPAQGKSGKKAAISKADPPGETVRGQGGKFSANAATTDFAAFERSHSHLLNQ